MTAIPNGEVSASKFNTAFGRAGCGMKFYYRYIEGLRGPVTASLLAGIAFDRATSQLHQYRMGVEIPAPDLEAEFVDAWENPDEENRDGEPVEFDLSDAPSDILERGANALKEYEWQTEGMVVTDVQVKVEAGFEETDAKLIGFIDLVERIKPGEYAVTDVKTSLSSRKKWAADEAVRRCPRPRRAVLALGLGAAAATVVAAGMSTLRADLADARSGDLCGEPRPHRRSPELDGSAGGRAVPLAAGRDERGGARHDLLGENGIAAQVVDLLHRRPC